MIGAALPRVSVVMAAYNEEIWIARAVSSILNQTLSELELIVVDDGSVDHTADILASFSDQRLRVLHQSNQGVAKALNQGIRVAKAGYIARMDADDWSRPVRLAQQVEFLENQPDYGLLGSSCEIVYPDCDRTSHFQVPLSDVSIRRMMVWDNPFVHSTVMIRKTILDAVGLYDPVYRWEDYELWWRVIAKSKVANLPEALVVRTHRDTSVSRIRKSQHYREMLRIQARVARRQGVSPLIYVALAKSAGAALIHQVLEFLPTGESRD
ncbi:MAG: glycosyltransferase [Chloroflexi bacterium]|nr:glycosyltransferase [Chloroflexota bacterium]